MDHEPPALTDLLDGPSRFHTLEHRTEVGSTNDVAAASLTDGVTPGLVIVADHQTAGRGRRGRTWEDRPEGASLLLSVTVAAPDERTLVPLAAGLAVAEALEELGVDATLKWPNDVLVGDLKVAGLLAEGHGDGLVVGIGTNVDLRRAPIDGATSVVEHLRVGAEQPDRWEVLAAELRAMDRWLAELDDGNEDAVVAAYRARCGTLGRDVRVDLADGTTPVLVGRAVDVTASGALLVERDDGSRVEVTAGDVHHVRAT